MRIKHQHSFIYLLSFSKPSATDSKFHVHSLLILASYVGFAYVGGACVVNKRLEKVNSVAIVEDTGGFSGIIVAAHEVGHL